jgi:prepilin-type N-terminal cleavage/methylation domain-containing protein
MLSLDTSKDQTGFTVIELLVVALIIGILLAIAIPKLFAARFSANEANTRKAMQTLRDGESLYFEQDLDGDGIRNYTSQIGNMNTGRTLRCPPSGGNCSEEDSLVDSTFEGALSTGALADCLDPKAGYCILFATDVDATDPLTLQAEYGWKASMTSARKTGRRDFAVYADGVIRCAVSLEITGDPGVFQADRTSNACDG